MAAMRKTTSFLLAASSVLLYACGSSGDGNGSGVSDAERDAAQVKFAQCMRSHGIDIPDPTPDGGIRVRVPKSIAPARMQQIDSGCRKSSGLDKAMPPPSAAEQKQASDAALKFARCMRSHGVEMPDPQVGNGRIAIRIPRGANPGSPRFKQAQQACQKLMPGKFGQRKP